MNNKHLRLIDRKEELENLLRTPETYNEIARKFGVSRAAIGLYAKKYHLRRIDLGLPRASGWHHRMKTGGWHSPNSGCIFQGKNYYSTGYLIVWDSDSSRYIAEHRLIMEKYIGRNLLESEIVHHRNGEK